MSSSHPNVLNKCYKHLVNNILGLLKEVLEPRQKKRLDRTKKWLLLKLPLFFVACRVRAKNSVISKLADYLVPSTRSYIVLALGIRYILTSMITISLLSFTEK